MADSLTVYLEVEGDAQARAHELLERARTLDSIEMADVQVEELERSDPQQLIESITLTLTAVGGLVGATNLLLAQAQKLVEEIGGFRRALIQTDEGLRELPIVSDTPKKENPAQ